MFLILFRKLLSNRWMILCLFIGSILTVAMLSSVPMYTNGILQKMLVKDLENYQQYSGVFAGGYNIKADIQRRYVEKNAIAAFKIFNNRISEKMAKEFNMPILAQYQEISAENFSVEPVVKQDKEKKSRYANMETMSFLQDHIKITHGRIFGTQKVEGVYEAIMTEEAMQKMDLMLDRTYIFTYPADKNTKFKVKVVGTFTMKDLKDIYWSQSLDTYKSGIFIDYDLYNNKFIAEDAPIISKSQWYFAFDYHKINLDNLNSILATYESQDNWVKKYSTVLTDKMFAVEKLTEYKERADQLKITLWVLQVPILLMLAFYIIMISKLVIDYDSNEIAVLKSRGASKLQVFMVYLMESSLLGVASIILGLPLGFFLCNILGSSNGFLEFVNRAALPIKLAQKAIFYSFAGIILFMSAMLIPALLTSRKSIVQYKQQRARANKWPFWKKYFLDVILLAISFYGLDSYSRHQKVLFISGIKSTEAALDPLLFAISTTFILGIGLLFLRIFPYIIQGIFWLGKKVWSPTLYASFLQVGRTGGQELVLMLFIIFTLSIGIFNANSARTINKNMEEKIRYEVGADITLMQNFSYIDKADRAEMSENEFGKLKDPPVLNEPDFKPFTELSGIEMATKVLKQKDVSLEYGGQWIEKVSLMGITPDEFGNVAWLKKGLLPNYFNEYLNLLAGRPDAVLLSSEFKEKYKLKEGDSISIKVGGSSGNGSFVDGVVVAFVDYWPSFNPNEKDRGVQLSRLVVTNFDYFFSKSSLLPYEVWLKKAPGATSNEIYKDMSKRKIEPVYISDATDQITKKKNDPMLQGTNGELTLDFIVTIVISMIGFLIYWIMSINKRILQFGILRAMGMSLKAILGMLACEQVMISGTAIAAGIIIGDLTSRIFVPILKVAYSSAEQIPPFKVVSYLIDYIRLYTAVALMLVIGFLILGSIISKIKISQAIKLGED